MVRSDDSPLWLSAERSSVAQPTFAEKRMGYLPIEDHGIIGDLRTAALVGVDGTIDWLCLPRFDAPSVFASILDDEKGGHFRLRPLDYVQIGRASCRERV